MESIIRFANLPENYPAIAAILEANNLGSGKPRLDTQNDAVNTAMVALNQKLGFVQTGVTLRSVKPMQLTVAPKEGEPNASI